MNLPAQRPSRDLTRSTLAVLSLAGLLVATFWIVRPFLSALLWATMIVISTWPLLLKVQAMLWGKRGLATTAMTLALLLVVIIPLGFSVGGLVYNTDAIVELAKNFDTLTIPSPPDWVAAIPLVGTRISTAWQRAAAVGANSLVFAVQPYAGRFLGWFAAQIGGVGAMILQFLLTVLISVILYANGEAAGRGVCRFFHRLAGPSGEEVAILAGSAVRGVAMGVVVTAVIQTAIAGAGLATAGMPGTALLTAVIFICCLAQLGPMLVMIPAVAWTYYSAGALWGTILLVFTIVSGTLDNIVRPILIRKGADLPLLLIFTGVMGGLIALGIVGIFVGPVILAVTYTLAREWVENKEGADDGRRPIQ